MNKKEDDPNQSANDGEYTYKPLLLSVKNIPLDQPWFEISSDKSNTKVTIVIYSSILGIFEHKVNLEKANEYVKVYWPGIYTPQKGDTFCFYSESGPDENNVIYRGDQVSVDMGIEYPIPPIINPLPGA